MNVNFNKIKKKLYRSLDFNVYFARIIFCEGVTVDI